MRLHLIGWALLAFIVGVLVLSDLTFQRRLQEKTLREVVDAADRFVDIGVVLHVVEADPNGRELIEGKPKLRILRTHRLGGTVDTKQNPPQIVGPSRAPITWFCSADQEPVILHGDADALGQLVYGSEGAGKTVALAMWHYVRWIEHLGEAREGGQTAPTTDRLDLVRQEMFRLYPSAWFRYRASDDILTFCDGTRVRLVSTYQQSKAQGSPVQGFSWSWCGRDEAQDQVDRHADIESRGRAAKAGRYKQLATATAKDHPDWQALRDSLETSGLWVRRTMLGQRSPFVDPSFWEAKRATLTEREFNRRVLAQDVGPERMLYHTWARAENLQVVPQFGAEDVTAQVLRPWGKNITTLVGHDPGKMWHVSLFLKAYRIGGAAQHSWFVVDEISDRQATIETHAINVLAKLRNDFGCNLLNWKGERSDGPVAMIRADPYSDSGAGDDHPDRGVYTTFRRHGLMIHPAAYTASTEKLKVGLVPKEGGIDMVCRLMQSASGDRRLFVACDDRRQPAAPKLVDAIQSMERDVAGRAEMERKDYRDKSHWPAALRYALWALERPRMERAT